jgi:hypothetical protein
MHATVFKCVSKSQKSDSSSNNSVSNKKTEETTFAVKICRNDNKEVLDAHETEY